jgi:23S rRNA (uracil1939-C5)-methyltransferase
VPLTLTIDKLVHGGMGLAHAEGKPCFVSEVLPGEVVTAEMCGKRGGCMLAQPTALLQSAPDRREPFCRHVGACGGCDWQHIAYERQVSLKVDIFRDCMARQGGIAALPEIEVYRSPEREYRLRTDLKLDVSRRMAGFCRRSSNAIVAIDSCPLLVPALNRFLGELPAVMGRLPSGAHQILALCGSDDTIASSPLVRDRTQPETAIAAGGHHFRVRGDSFFQQNRHQLATLGGWADDSLSGGICLDLYGGCGFFSVFHGRHFARGLLVEQEATLVAMARDNFARNGVEHFAGETVSAERFFSRGDSSPSPDCIIVDPPRQGLAPVARDGIRRLSPATLLYISCDPATQARDVGFLVKHGGYRITRAAFFDLYPNTHHLETGLVLSSPL